MPGGPWARQYADEAPEGEGGQSADPGALLLPHPVKFTLGCCFQRGNFHREAQDPKVKVLMRTKRKGKLQARKWRSREWRAVSVRKSDTAALDSGVSWLLDREGESWGS